MSSLKADPNAVGTYSVDLLFNPDGVSFGYAKISDSVGTRYIELENTQMTGGNGYTVGRNAWFANFEKWRLVYGGLTIYQDGPALANQGTVAACQYTMKSRTMTTDPHWVTMNVEGHSLNPGVGVGSHRLLSMYDATDCPSYERSQQQPNAFFGESKNGVYMPLRLGANHQEWRSEKDATYFVATPSERTDPALNPGFNVPWQYHDDSYVFPARNASGTLYFWPGVSNLGDGITGASINGHPHHPSIPSFHWILNADNATAIDGSCCIKSASSHCMMLPPIAEMVGSICFRNLAVTTGLQCYFRLGIEAQTKLSSSYTPYLKVAPAFDRLAVDNYFRISRELKDAYPSEFNDLGKLWEVIKSAMRVALPAVGTLLSRVPGPIGVAASALTPLVSSFIRPSGVQVVNTPNTAPRDKPPAAALERAQRAVLVTRRKMVSMKGRKTKKALRRRK